MTILDSDVPRLGAGLNQKQVKFFSQSYEAPKATISRQKADTVNQQAQPSHKQRFFAQDVHHQDDRPCHLLASFLCSWCPEWITPNESAHGYRHSPHQDFEQALVDGQ